MRLFSIVALSLALPLSLRAADPEVRPTPTIVPEAAEAGKDVVHQLNNAFAKVFEVVAPSVVIIETTKKPDVSDNPTLDDLFFNQQQQQPDEGPRRSPRDRQPQQSEGS